MKRGRSGVPQIEDGFAKVAQELLEALARANLTKEEHSVFYVVMMKTYGWDKTHDWIATTQISEATGIAPEHCSRAVSGLVAKGLITRRMVGRRLVLAIQKRYLQWTCLRPKLAADKTRWRQRRSQPQLAGPLQPESAGVSQPELAGEPQPESAGNNRTSTTELVTEEEGARKSETDGGLDPKVRAVVEDHLGPDCWHQTLLKLVKDLASEHGVEHFLAAETEAAKSAVPAKAFIRYLDATLRGQKARGYPWSRGKPTAARAADPEVAFFQSQPLYRQLSNDLASGPAFAYRRMEHIAEQLDIDLREFVALTGSPPVAEQENLIRRFVSLSLPPSSLPHTSARVTV